jgi:hypothetical protein
MPALVTVRARGASRFMPLLPVQAYRSFTIRAPLGPQYWRKATCAEVGCPKYAHGWRVRVEHLTPDLVHAAEHSGRRFTRHAVADGETWLVFEAAQPCFEAAAHRVRVHRPERLLQHDGDWRGNPTGHVREYTRWDDWLDASATHLGNLAEAIQKG